MNKKKISIFLGAIFIVCFFTCLVIVNKTENIKVDNSKLKVVTTLFPLFDMAKNIGGDKAEVTLLLPPGVEAHAFEPRPSDIVKINDADIFVYTGKFMEPWVEDILKSVTNKNLIVVDASQGVKMVPGVFHDADEPAGTMDPHIWLDFDNAKIMVNNIERAFVEKGTNDSNFYKRNASSYSQLLSLLDNKYQAALLSCQTQEIIYGGHYAFGYLANRYGLKYLAAQGVSPDAEPTASDLTNLIDQINENKIQYVFYEELTSPKIAEMISRETNAKLLLLNAAHNLAKDQFESGVTFFDILNSNLNNLKIGLNCK